MSVVTGGPCDYQAPFSHLYLFYHIGSERPYILVRRYYTIREAMEDLWKILKKNRGPFGAWNLVALGEEGEHKGEWAYRITDSYLSDPIQLTSCYMEDKCMMSRF